MKTVVFVVALIASAVAEKISYENYKVYNVKPSSEEQVEKLVELLESGEHDFWTEKFLVGNDVRIMVAPEKMKAFLEFSEDAGLEAAVSIPNVQKLINDQLKPTQRTNRNVAGNFNWNEYHTIDHIYSWLEELPGLFPGIVTVHDIGHSIEGRPLKLVKIDFRAGNRGPNPLIGMIEGGIHAREWISPATVTWIINDFLTSEDPEVRFLAENFVWHILPVANPDGYAYTFSDNRMWRKNRNPNHFTTCNNNNDISNGIDLNRNFDFRWMSTGASQNPCDETFAGPRGTSENEAQAIANYVLNLKNQGQVIYYFAFHSFSQMILVPYSHAVGNDKLEAHNYGDLYEIAIRGAEKLTEVHGIPYAVGTSAEILYPVSGSSFDWVKGVADIPIVYLFELRDVGQFGFLLPTEQIIPNNEEIVACLVEMDKTTRNLRYYYAEMDSGAGVMTNSVMMVLGAAALFLFH